MLGKMYRKAKIVGLYGVGRNYIMMKLEEVGSNSHSENGGLDMPILSFLSALFPSVLVLVLLEVLPQDF